MMEKSLTQEQAMVELEKGYSKAKNVLRDKETLDDLLVRLERKLKVIPKIGEKLSYIPTFIQLLKAYYTKEYTKIPLVSLVSITSALLYFVNPLDLIPDPIPGVGYLDDAAIIGACFLLVETDIKEFIQWRDSYKALT